VAVLLSLVPITNVRLAQMDRFLINKELNASIDQHAKVSTKFKELKITVMLVSLVKMVKHQINRGPNV
jgi:hypothetical protein